MFSSNSKFQKDESRREFGNESSNEPRRESLNYVPTDIAPSTDRGMASSAALIQVVDRTDYTAANTTVSTPENTVSTSKDKVEDEAKKEAKEDTHSFENRPFKPPIKPLLVLPGEQPTPLVSSSDLMDGILKDLEVRHNTKQCGGWTGGLRCGFSLIDNNLRGFRPHSLTILAAEPKIGKTTLANQIAYETAVFSGQQANVIYVTLEMAPEELLKKHLARLSGWPLHSLEDGNVPQMKPGW